MFPSFRWKCSICNNKTPNLQTLQYKLVKCLWILFTWGQSIFSGGGMRVLLIQRQLFYSWYSTEQVYFQNWIDTMLISSCLFYEGPNRLNHGQGRKRTNISLIVSCTFKDGLIISMNADPPALTCSNLHMYPFSTWTSFHRLGQHNY